MNIIYGLKDPITDEYYYVGKSIHGIERAKNHLTYSHNFLVREWVLSLASQEQEPIIDILEQCDNPLILPNKERFWIDKLLSEKHPLLNIVIYDNFADKYKELNRLNKECDVKINLIKNRLENLKENTMVETNGLSQFIKNRRKFAGLSRVELADLSGIGKTVVYDIENGKKTFRFNTLQKILKALNIKQSFYV